MQTKKLMDRISNSDLIIDYAMRYGNPSIKNKVNKLHDAGCERLVVLPLYPQYAAATTATVCDEVYRVLMGMRWQPSLQIIPHYESEPLYINALSNSLNLKIKELNWKPDLVIASYHGIPQKYFDRGDHLNASLKFEEAIKNNPLDYSHYENAATSNYLTGNLQKALEQIDWVIDII